MALFGVLGFFGEVPFTCSSEQVATFNDVQVQHQSRYANHDILGQKPVHEYVGPANSTVSFKVKLYAQHNAPPSLYIELLQDMLNSGEAQRLMLGTRYYGKYILTGFTENQQFFNGVGNSIVTEVTLNLEEAQGFSLFQYLKNLL